MVNKVSVPRSEGMPGLAINPKDSLILVDVDDIDSFPGTDSGGVKVTENVTLKTGKTAVGVYGTPGKFTVTEPSEGEVDTTGFVPQVVMSHPGNELPIREFKAWAIGKRLIVFVAYCNGKVDMIGTPCNPCTLSTSYTGNNESSANELTFKQVSRGEGIKVYEGELPTLAAAPAGSINS